MIETLTDGGGGKETDGIKSSCMENSAPDVVSEFHLAGSKVFRLDSTRSTRRDLMDFLFWKGGFLIKKLRG